TNDRADPNGLSIEAVHLVHLAHSCAAFLPRPIKEIITCQPMEPTRRRTAARAAPLRSGGSAAELSRFPLPSPPSSLPTSSFALSWQSLGPSSRLSPFFLPPRARSSRSRCSSSPERIDGTVGRFSRHLWRPSASPSPSVRGRRR